MSPVYPPERAKRQVLREDIRTARLERAEREAREVGGSIKCGTYGRHADQDGGCANDGTGCLCPCHDRVEP